MMRSTAFRGRLPFVAFHYLNSVVFGLRARAKLHHLLMMVALLKLSWPATARLVRGQILQIRQEA